MSKIYQICLIAFNFEISKAYTVVRQVERNRNYKIRFFGKNKTSFLKLGFERAEGYTVSQKITRKLWNRKSTFRLKLGH